MDPASIIASILSCAVPISQWLDDSKKKDVAISNLATTVNLVYLDLSSLEADTKPQNLETPILASLFSLGEILGRIKDHFDI